MHELLLVKMVAGSVCVVYALSDMCDLPSDDVWRAWMAACRAEGTSMIFLHNSPYVFLPRASDALSRW